jgi:hypothetical protein
MNLPTPSAESGIPAAFLTTSMPTPKRNAASATIPARTTVMPPRGSREIRLARATRVPPGKKGLDVEGRRPATAPPHAQVPEPVDEASLPCEPSPAEVARHFLSRPRRHTCRPAVARRWPLRPGALGDRASARRSGGDSLARQDCPPSLFVRIEGRAHVLTTRLLLQKAGCQLGFGAERPLVVRSSRFVLGPRRARSPDTPPSRRERTRG